MKLHVVLALGCAIALPSPAFATDPHGTTLNPNPTGQPSQSCQDLSADPINGPFPTPGHTAGSPGSPFNEPTPANGMTGGNGGAHYSGSSQYDVACFQQSQHQLR
jgi:hypothetical protein